MPKMVKRDTKTEIGRSRESMLALWVGKQLKPDVEARAEAESARTGIRINGNALAKEIFLWAWDLYLKAGSLAELKRMPRFLGSNRISAENYEQALTSLRIILDRAPSAIIEEVARKLTAWAGKYGDEK